VTGVEAQRVRFIVRCVACFEKIARKFRFRLVDKSPKTIHSNASRSRAGRNPERGEYTDRSRREQRQSAPAVLQQAPALNQIGKGSQSYFGLRVYHVTLWAASDRWNPEEPHALYLESNRAISKDQLTDAGMSEMDRLGLGNSHQRQAWRKEMERVLPSVNRGDQLVVFCAPNPKTFFFYNGRELGEIDDPAFGAAFFGICSIRARKTPRSESRY
jgi:hypothetical protein